MNKLLEIWNDIRNSKVIVLESITLYLVNGSKVVAQYEADEYDELYAQWEAGRGIMAFRNCCVHAKDVVLMEYKG